MFGRRHESGKQLKRTRKHNLITLAIIGTIAYFLYRSILAPSKIESPPPVEQIRQAYDRGVNQIRSEIRINGDRLRNLDVGPGNRREEFPEHAPSLKTSDELFQKANEFNVIDDKIDNHEAKAEKLGQNETESKTKEEHADDNTFVETGDGKGKTVDEQKAKKLGLNSTEKRTSSSYVPMADRFKYPNKTENRSMNNTDLKFEPPRRNISKLQGIITDNNMSKDSLFKGQDAAKPQALLAKLNGSIHETHALSSVISLYQDDENRESDSECVNLTVRGGQDSNGSSVNTTTTTICIHNVTEDRFVSGILKKHGTWEQGDLDGMGTILRNHSDMVLIDAGCNIGAYSLYAAKLGTKVIAIDPFRRHLKLLNKSLKLNKQEHAVTLLWNAVSDKHTKVNLSQTQTKNLGSVNILIKDPTRKVGDYSVQLITLNDLADKFNLNATKVFLKMDMEGSEYNALMGGIRFFKRANVCVVLMEFVSYKANERGAEIVEFMETFGLSPYEDLRLKKRLDVSEVPLKNFPLNTVFAKNTTECTRR